MKIDKNEFVNLLITKARESDIALNDEQAQKLYYYKEILLEWNDKINLTAITEDEDIIIKHFIDSLLCIDCIKEGENVIDVGTGAGFPGIVLAIYFEGNIDITLLDSLNKRVIFLNEVISKLQLKNVKAIHGRAEEVAQKQEYREKYDIAIARAVAPLNILLEYLSGFVREAGKCICMKSVSAEEELDKANNAISILKLNVEAKYINEIEYKKEQITRQIIVLRKGQKLNSKYPRSYGKIKKNPL